ncbi:MAG: glycosyltransferase [Anaerolineae bacterium]
MSGASGQATAVTVIATVLNEGQAIEDLLASLRSQTRLPDEVIIVDGGSRDDTVARLRRAEAEGSLKLRVLQAPGANISLGRNIAIRAASSPLIAVTDAGVRLDRRWLEHITEPFARADVPDVVSGFFVPDARSAFEIALAATTLPALRDVRPERFLPSSRSVAFRKDAWEAVGGYPEWLDYCEDLIFDLRLRDTGHRFMFVPEARVAFRPRPNLPAFCRQYYRYARGDGKADLWRKRHAVRYGTYLLVTPALVALAIALNPWWLLGLLAGAALMLATPYRRLLGLWGPLGRSARLVALLWVPVIRLAGDAAKMLGYPAGLAWRRAHRNQPELQWRLPAGAEPRRTSPRQAG